MKRTLGLALGLAVIGQPALGQGFFQWPQNVNWQIATGFDYSEGKYGGTTKTTVWSVPVDARLELDRLRIEMSLPYEHVTGPGILAGGVVIGSGPVSSRSGIGDLNLTGAFLLTRDGEFPAIDIGGTIKFPTAKSDIGTRKFDYSIQSNIYHSFTPWLMIFGSVGYQWLTSTSTVALKDGVTASGGVNFKATNDVSLGVSANFRQEYFDTLGDQFTVSPYAMWNFAPNWRVTAYGTAGSGRASPEFGAGARLAFYQ